MTAAEARAMADEQIAIWKNMPRWAGPVPAHEAWQWFSTAPYPGGGWERVRAEMIRWQLDQAAPARLAA